MSKDIFSSPIFQCPKTSLFITDFIQCLKVLSLYQTHSRHWIQTHGRHHFSSLILFNVQKSYQYIYITIKLQASKSISKYATTIKNTNIYTISLLSILSFHIQLTNTIQYPSIKIATIIEHNSIIACITKSI
jgi:hypothetical protein